MIPGLKYVESKTLFEEVDPKVEKWTRYFFILDMKIVYPLSIGMLLVCTYLLYFFTDSGNDAFQMGIVFW